MYTESVTEFLSISYQIIIITFQIRLVDLLYCAKCVEMHKNKSPRVFHFSIIQ